MCRTLTCLASLVLLLGAVNSALALGPATDPSPANGATLADTWVTLSWKPGIDAFLHYVYFGDSFDDVNDGAIDTFQGSQDSATFVVGFPGFAYPDGLVPGTTYYWRIDELYDPDQSPWRGDVWSFTVPPKKAYNPSPPDGAEFIDPELELSWTAGFGAKLHIVYFGDNFDDVNNATEGMLQGTTTYFPGDLPPDKTYYWRVDEFDDLNIYKGDVWRFTTTEAPQPQRPLPPINPSPSNGATNQSIDVDISWVDGGGATSYGIYFGTDPTPDSSEYKRSQTGTSYDPGTLNYSTNYYWRIDATNSSGPTTGYVWRFTTEALRRPDPPINPSPRNRATNQSINVVMRWENGGGATSYRIYFGTDPTPDSSEYKRSQTGTSYDPGTLNYSTIYYWRIDATNSSGTTIGDVWRFTTEPPPAIDGGVMAESPYPHNGAFNVSQSLTLRWRAGDEAVEHDVYFGNEAEAVANAYTTTFGIYRGRQSETTHTLNPLEENTTYYWRIDEVQADRTTIVTGNVWSFTTAFFIVDDDFESFTDEVGQRIFETWIDGTDNPYNGATVPYADQTTVFSGKQSMLFEYNNTGDNVVYSEAKRTFDPPHDWTNEDEDIDSLVLFVHGRPGNEADTLYIGIEDSTGRPAWVENPDPDVLGSDEWTPWRIPLSDFAEQGINLNSVMTMSIGVGEPPEEGDELLNDDCVNARPIGNVTNLWFDTTSATFDGPGYCTISPNIWYVYTATQSGGLTISLCGSSYDTTIAVYDGSDCPPKLEDMLRCNDDFCGLQSEVEFAVTAGNQYLIEVGGFGFNSGQGQGVMTISHENGWNGRPSNDDCDNAMSVGNVTNLRFDTTYATFDGPGYCMESPNIWYTYYADHTGNVTVSLCGSSYDSKLAIYRKSPGWYPTEDDLIECNDDFCDTNAEITFTAFAGSHYLIEVGAYNGETGQGVLSISSEDDLANPILRDGPKLFANPRRGEGKFNVDSIITVGPSFGVLMGKVKSSNGDGEGQPISGATVTLSTNPPSSLGPFKNLLPTGIDGFYAVCLIKGQTYNVNVSAPGSSKSFGVVEFKSDDNWVKTKNLEMP